MDLLRRHLFLIVCGLAGVGGIALGLTGMRAMPDVQKELEKAASLHRNLGSLQSNPVNRQRIQEEQERVEVILNDHKRILEHARRLYDGYDLLVPAVLPYGTPVARLDFRRKYGEAMRALFDSLTSGQPASDAEIGLWRKRIEEDQLARAEGGGKAAGATLKTAAGVLTAEGIKYDAAARAHLEAAQRVYCYATPFQEGPKKAGAQDPSLYFDPIMAMVDTVDPPFPADCWTAQLGYWLQRDVVDAIVAMNEAAAKQAQDAGQHPWVGIMPVKEVISIRISDGFVPPEGDIFMGHKPGGYEPALPPGSPAAVFTQRGSGSFYDVVHFTVKLVMDERDILSFVDELCNNRFHTPLRIAYEAVPPNREFKGKIYGSEPAVNVVMDFETVLLGQVFRRWMPQYTRETFGVQCREIDGCQPEPGP